MTDYINSSGIIESVVYLDGILIVIGVLWWILIGGENWDTFFFMAIKMWPSLLWPLNLGMQKRFPENTESRIIDRSNLSLSSGFSVFMLKGVERSRYRSEAGLKTRPLKTQSIDKDGNELQVSTSTSSTTSPIFLLIPQHDTGLS